MEPALELVEVASAAEHLPVLSDHLETHPQVAGNQVGPEVGGADLNARNLVQGRREGGGEAVRGEVRPGETTPGGVAERNDSPADRARQGPQQRHRLLFPAAGHEPFESLGLEGSEDRGRDPGRDPVVRVLRREAVGERDGNPRHLDLVRELPRGRQPGSGPDQIAEREAEALRIGQRIVPAPEAAFALDFLGNPGLEEAGAGLVADEEVLPPSPSLDSPASSRASPGCAARTRPPVTRPPFARPSDMKIVRAPAGSTGANRTRRRGTTVRPYRTTRSSAITSPRSGSKCGSKYSRVTSSRADRSIHWGRIRAATWRRPSRSPRGPRPRSSARRPA